MAKNTTVFYTKDARFVTTAIGAVPADIFTAGADGSKILSLVAIRAGTYRIFYNDGVDSEILPSSVVAAGADLLALMHLPKTAAGSPYFNMAAVAKLRALETGAAGTIAVYSEDY